MQNFGGTNKEYYGNFESGLLRKYVRIGDQKKKKKLKFSKCSIVYTNAKNKSFHVVDRIRTAAKFIKMKIAHTKRAKLTGFFLCVSLLKMQISDVLVVTVVVVT